MSMKSLSRLLFICLILSLVFIYIIINYFQSSFSSGTHILHAQIISYSTNKELPEKHIKNDVVDVEGYHNSGQEYNTEYEEQSPKNG